MKENTRTTPNNTTRKHTDTGRTERGAADMNNPNLHRLKDLDDYKVASDDPDVRGWNVLSGDNEVIGTVDELIVDTKRMKVRYLVVNANDRLGFDQDEPSLLIPIGAARLHEKNNDVIVSNLTTTNARTYPIYRGDTISRDYEQSIRRFYEAGGTVPAATTTETITENETIRDAHTGKTYERQDRPSVSGVDSNSRNRVDVVTGTSKEDNAFGAPTTSDTPEENRIGDRAKEDSNTMNQTHSSLDRRPDSNTQIGEFNTTDAGDVSERVRTRGISSSRTSNLPNKELKQGPSNEADHINPEGVSESERVRIHDTNPENIDSDAGRADDTRGTDFNETSNLNRSTSLGNDTKRGSNMGNLENRSQTPGINDRSRMSSPEFTDRTSTPGASRHPEKYPEAGTGPVDKKNLEHSSDELPDDRYDPDTDEFYTHTHFDEERFYGDRRNRRDDNV